jgi:hypothetical protein
MICRCREIQRRMSLAPPTIAERRASIAGLGLSSALEGFVQSQIDAAVAAARAEAMAEFEERLRHADRGRRASITVDPDGVGHVHAKLDASSGAYHAKLPDNAGHWNVSRGGVLSVMVRLFFM